MDTNPIQRLSSVLLNEFNYLPWSRAISLALGGRGKLPFIQKDDIIPETTAPDYAAWVSQDQLIMSWLLNFMEPKMAEIFSYSVSSHQLWNSVRDMYGDLNNAARVFQLKKDLTELQQGNLSFVQHLGNLKAKWNELDLYRPHTTDTTILLKRAEEDKVFQLLASIGPDYEDLRSHLLMTPELPTLQMVCNVIQREEVRKKVMNADMVVGESNFRPSEARAFTFSRPYKGKRPDLKCSHCVKIGRTGIGHIKEKCWILYPELKPKFNDDGRAPRNQMKPAYTPRGNLVCDNVSNNVINSSSSLIALINEFANFLQQKQGATNHETPSAMLGKFAGFLEQSNSVSQNDMPGIIATISTALDLSSSCDFWIVDSGASDHMTNDASLLNDFQNFSTPSFVSVANGTKDQVSKETIGKGFFLNGLYYVKFSSSFPKSFYVNSSTGELSYEVFPTPLFLDDTRLSTPQNEAVEIEPAPESMEADNEEVILERREPQLEQPPPPRRNPSRNRQPPARLDDFEIYTPRHPIGQMVFHSKSSPSHAVFVTKLSQNSEPRSFEEAHQSPVWRQAMLEELKALDENQTWSIVSLPKGQRVVGARWIYKTKFHSDGNIERHKARLVARASHKPSE
ncbi:uncharacterized protein [Pyrus communis]|uniref:uncharacterized protein n=1 Tax=Pyrus communis TaxID=23211 RepID=UPI0035BFC18B